MKVPDHFLAAINGARSKCEWEMKSRAISEKSSKKFQCQHERSDFRYESLQMDHNFCSRLSFKKPSRRRDEKIKYHPDLMLVSRKRETHDSHYRTFNIARDIHEQSFSFHHRPNNNSADKNVPPWLWSALTLNMAWFIRVSLVSFAVRAILSRHTYTTMQRQILDENARNCGTTEDDVEIRIHSKRFQKSHDLVADTTSVIWLLQSWSLEVTKRISRIRIQIILIYSRRLHKPAANLHSGSLCIWASFCLL